MAKCPVVVAFNTEGQTSLIYCGRWSCPRCSRHNAGKWAKRAQLGLEKFAGESEADAWFLTLTLGSQYSTSRAGYKDLPRLWNSTRMAYQRYYAAFTYMAFVEGQDNRGGMPHFHIISLQQPPTKRGKRGYVTQHGVHDFAVAYGWGYQAKLELVTSNQTAVYVSKYASKGDPSMPRSFRRVRVSRDFPQLPDLGGSPLLVPSRSEDVARFIARVADATGLDPDILYPRYLQAEQTLYNERL